MVGKRRRVEGREWLASYGKHGPVHDNVLCTAAARISVGHNTIELYRRRIIKSIECVAENSSTNQSEGALKLVTR